VKLKVLFIGYGVQLNLIGWATTRAVLGSK